MLKRIVLAVLAACCLTVSAFGQKQVTGTVTDSSGAPLPGVSVIVGGTSVGTVTDAEGNYSITAKDGDSLQFFFFGMKNQSIAVGDKAKINVRMEDDTTYLDEAVVTAMGISRQEKTLGYSATTVKSDVIAGAHLTNVASAISGKVAGVSVQSTSADPVRSAISSSAVSRPSTAATSLCT